MRVSRKTSLAVGCSLIAFAAALPAAAQDVPAQDEATQVDEVIVTGIRASIADALSTKRNSDVVMDSISAQDIGELPDQNVSETLSRVPGVQITRREGEGAKINVRGIDLNRVQLNGRSFVGASSNGDPNLGDFPSEILAGIDVIKSPSADLAEGWLGAVINLRTRRPLDLRGELLSAQLQTSYADTIEAFGGRAAGAYGRSFFDGRLGLMVSGTVTNFKGRADAFSNRGFSRLTGVPLSGPGASNANVFRPNRFEGYIIEFDTDRYGVNGTLQWRPSDDLTLTFDAFRSNSTTDRTRYVTQYIFPGTFTNANVLADGTVNRATVTGVTVRPIIFNGPSENNAEAFALTGQYRRDRWSIDFGASSSSGDSDGGNDQGSQGFLWFGGQDYVAVTRQIAGNTASVTYDTNGSLLSPNYTVSTNYNISDPNQYEVFTVVDQEYVNANEGSDADFDVTYDAEWGLIRALKFGARWEEIGAEQFTRVITYTAAQLAAGDPTPGTTLRANETAGLNYGGTRDNLFGGEGGAFPRSILAGTFDEGPFRRQFAGVPSAADIATRRVGTLDVEQTTSAYYARVDFGGMLGDIPYSGNVGVRQVETERESNGFDRTGPTTTAPRSETAEFSDTLPSFNLAFELPRNAFLRFAAAKVLARPPLSLTGVGINFNPTAATGSAGNPDLEPFRADQFDVSAEWYFAPASLLSVAAFYKNVGAFTRTITTIEDHPEVVAPGLTNTLYNVSRPVNGTDGTIEGFEVNYYHAFTFLPAPFDGLGLNVSYTHTSSSTPNIDELTGQELGLPNLSEDSYNIVGYYEKDGLNFRLAYNYRGDYLLAQQPASLGGSLYNDERGQLDASFSYQINDTVQVTFDAQNLTKSRRSIYTGTENRLTTTWQDDRRFFAGISAVF